MNIHESGALFHNKDSFLLAFMWVPLFLKLPLVFFFVVRITCHYMKHPLLHQAHLGFSRKQILFLRVRCNLTKILRCYSLYHIQHQVLPHTPVGCTTIRSKLQSSWQFPKIGGPQYRPQNTMILFGGAAT